MKFLIQALKEKTDAKLLSTIVEKNLSGYEPARPYDVIHASMLTGWPDFCPREVALLDILKKSPPPKWHSMAQQICYDQGNALHEQARNTWFEGAAVGDWQCVVCKTELVFRKRPKHPCPKCTNKLWRYRETTFQSQFPKVQGSVDLFVDFGDGKHVLTEVKTEDKDSFKTLKMAKGEHRVRTNLYLWIIRNSQSELKDRIDLNRGKVLYISKAFGTKGDDNKISPLKEFWVEYDSKVVEPYVEKAVLLQMFRDKTGPEGLLPPGVCPNSYCTRAKNCSMMKECWGGKYTSWKLPV